MPEEAFKHQGYASSASGAAKARRNEFSGPGENHLPQSGERVPPWHRCSGTVFSGCPRFQPRMHSCREAGGARCLGIAKQSWLGFRAGEGYDERRENNLQVNLVTRIPVLIVYGTAAVNEENQ